MNLKSVVFAIAACIVGGCTPSLSVDKLSCEYLTNPLGVDVEHPRFSWIIDAAGERGVYQQAYRVVVSDKADELRSKTGNHWDSGWTDSDHSSHVEYAGQPLVGNHAYYWQVGVKVNGSDMEQACLFPYRIAAARRVEGAMGEHERKNHAEQSFVPHHFQPQQKSEGSIHLFYSSRHLRIVPERAKSGRGCAEPFRERLSQNGVVFCL